jgi:hypothetical protein
VNKRISRDPRKRITHDLDQRAKFGLGSARFGRRSGQPLSLATQLRRGTMSAITHKRCLRRAPIASVLTTKLNRPPASSRASRLSRVPGAIVETQVGDQAHVADVAQLVEQRFRKP